MKLLCEVCEKAGAVVLCCEDEAAMCASCDQEVHGANVLAGKHCRLPLQGGGAAPGCDICQREGKGMFFCPVDRATLCRKCDFAVHSANDEAKAHVRFPFSGMTVSLERLNGCLPCPPASTAANRATPAVSAAPLLPPVFTHAASPPKLGKTGRTASYDSFNAFLENELLARVPDAADLEDAVPRVPSLSDMAEFDTGSPNLAPGSSASVFAAAKLAMQQANQKRASVSSDSASWASDGVVPDVTNRRVTKRVRT